MKKIYFFANFGDWSKQPYGGGEVGNRRTLELLRQTDYDIIPIESYIKVPRNNIWNKIRFFSRVSNTVLKYITTLVFGQRKQSLLHVVGFYGVKLPFDYLMVSIGKFFGYRVIYEMRGGGAEYFYNTMGNGYKKKFDSIIRKSDYIFSQGKENEVLIHEIDPDKHIFYYPNYVMDSFFPECCPVKPTGKVNMIYFGRISPTKNIDVVVKTFVNLHKRYNYDNIYLEIVGNYEDPEYYEKIKLMIHEAGVDKYVNIKPACNHEELKTVLQDKHIYIFPTKEPREGHSNAMTEAMAWGVIPVAAGHGFNRSVISNDKLIVEDIDADMFAKTIDSLIKSGDMSAVSGKMHDRVGKHYTQGIAYQRLKDEYHQLLIQNN